MIHSGLFKISLCLFDFSNSIFYIYVIFHNDLAQNGKENCDQDIHLKDVYFPFYSCVDFMNFWYMEIDQKGVKYVFMSKA